MRLFSSVALAAGLLAFAPSAHAGDQDFTLVNRTGYQIDDLWVSPSRSDSWGREIMGRGNVLSDGDTYDVSFSRHAQACHFDLKVQYNDGDVATWRDLNLCEISKVSLYWDRKNNTTRARTE